MIVGVLDSLSMYTNRDQLVLSYSKTVTVVSVVMVVGESIDMTVAKLGALD